MYAFPDDFTSICKNRSFISIYVSLSVFLTVEQQGKVCIFIVNKIGLQHFFAVVFCFTVWMFYRELIVKAYLAASREIIWICIFFVTDLLDGRILSGVNTKTTAVKCIVGLSLCIASLFLEVMDDLLSQFINKISVGLIYLFLLLFYILNPFIYVVCQTFVILLFGNVILIQHMIQYSFTPFCIFFRIDSRIESGRVLADSGNDSTF